METMDTNRFYSFRSFLPMKLKESLEEQLLLKCIEYIANYRDVIVQAELRSRILYTNATKYNWHISHASIVN